MNKIQKCIEDSERIIYCTIHSSNNEYKSCDVCKIGKLLQDKIRQSQLNLLKVIRESLPKEIKTFSEAEKITMNNFEPTSQQQNIIDCDLRNQGFNQALVEIKESLK